MTEINAKTKEQNAAADRIERWRWMIEQDVPLIGGWMHRRIASALIDAALSGNWLAAQSLAVVFVFRDEADVRQMAGETLRKINYATGMDAVWGVWAETRDPALGAIALEYHHIANHPASVRLLSALKLGSKEPEVLNAIINGGAELIPPLIQACTDLDSSLAALARQTLLNLRSEAAIDAVCLAWQANRSPFLAEVIQQAGYVAQRPADTRLLSALKVNQMSVVAHSSSDMIAPLITACQDADPEIASRARESLPFLQEPSAIDAFCNLWAETRSLLLEETLLRSGYQARGPGNVRLLVALKTNRLDVAEDAGPEDLPGLLSALQDQDDAIRANAASALAHLKREETIDALCSRVIETDDPQARAVALTNAYAPRTPELRALFYFLTHQWDAYDALDFDQSMMRVLYEASPQELRQRIAARVQQAGRSDYLTILAGVDYRARAQVVTASEAELMIRILAQNHDFSRLWSLAPELALPFSLEIIRILDQNGWRPVEALDQPVFAELQRLSRGPIQVNGAEVARALPPALSRATLKVKGRINAAAFSPTQPVLAIATSQRKVALWNFQTAQIERVLREFDHSVGRVVYTPQGELIVAERTNNSGLCSVYVFGDEEFTLSAHQGAVTVLEPAGEWLLTAGRDSQAFLWDLPRKKQVVAREFPFWPRSAAISPDRQYAAFLHDRLNLVHLPDLTLVQGNPFLALRSGNAKPGVAHHAAFSPDGKYLFAGQNNGQVRMYYHTSLTQTPRKAVAAQHSQAVQGLHFLPGHSLLVTAGGEGQVRFIRWPELKQQGAVYTPEGTLTSLNISPNGAFMATGASDSSLDLWDLRVLDIPDLFTQPLAAASHEQISTVLALGAYATLPEPVRNGLLFLRLLLQYRFRYDVQIAEAPAIPFGEFDILLDETSNP